MSDISEALDALLTDDGPGWQQCGVAYLLTRVEPAVAEKIAALIDSPSVKVARIASVLAEHGYGVPAYTISRHRRRGTGGGCQCPT